MVHYQLGQLELAVEQQKKVVELAPRRPGGHTNLAVFYDLLGCSESAIASYEAALSLEPKVTTYTNLAVTSFYAGLYAEALEAAQAAKALLDRGSQQASVERSQFVESGNLGDIYYWSPGGDQETAIAFYREALELVDEELKTDPGDPDALAKRAWYLAMLGEKDSARRCLDALLAMEPLGYENCYKLALTYQRLGESKKALHYLKLSLDQGQPADYVRYEPIFRGNHAVEDLLSQYSRESKACP